MRSTAFSRAPRRRYRACQSQGVPRQLILRLLPLSMILFVSSAQAHPNEEAARSSHGSPQKASSGKSRFRYVDYQVAAGTPLSIRLRTPLDSASARVDDAVRGTLVEAVSQDGVELVPKGSTLHGKVIEVVQASKENRTGRIVLAFHVIEHIETHSLATIATRGVPYEAELGPKEKFRDVRVPADARVLVTLASPLKVHIPRSR
jgi:hypothetical protein